MPRIPIIMPQLGESIAEATVVQMLVNPGDEVRGDQDVMEVETNKAVMTVTSPGPGTVESFSAEVGKSYPVGSTLGWLEVTAEVAARLGFDEPSPSAAATPQDGGHAEAATPTPAPAQGVSPTVRGLPVPAHVAGASYISPRMKARMNELGLHAADMAGIAGSGAGGRVTIDDLESFLAGLESLRITNASSMRVAVADAMRRSWTRPLATCAIPVVLDPVLAHRRTAQPKPGPALYALRALGIALAENSAPAGRLIGGRVVHPRSIDIGFAVEAEDGVLVPVIRNVDQTPLAQLTAAYLELVELARQRRLPSNATGGSIATVTNFGTFGLTWATPIPLPEQTLVLGMGAGKIAPSWDAASASFQPVTEANLTLSFDHRVLDGGAAGRLLLRIADLMSRPEAL